MIRFLFSPFVILVFLWCTFHGVAEYLGEIAVITETTVFGDNAAADLVAGVSGRLRGEIIGRAVNDQGASDDLRQLKPIGIKGAVGIPLVAEKGRQVAGMIRVRQSAGIVVSTGLIEGKSAVARLVNMHAVELTVRCGIFVRQTVDFCFDQHTTGRNRVKIGGSMQGRMIGAAFDLCVSAGISIMSHVDFLF